MRAFKAIGLGLVCATLATGGVAQSNATSTETLASWGKVGMWDIYVNPLLGDGCLMRGMFSGGTEVRLGIDARTDQPYLAMFNDMWDINPGTVVPLRVTLDEVEYTTEVTELAEYGRQGAVVFFDNNEIFRDLANKRTMSIYADGESITAIDLTGIDAAVPEVFTCQDAQG